jgi:hypothetical protein
MLASFSHKVMTLAVSDGKKPGLETRILAEITNCTKCTQFSFLCGILGICSVSKITITASNQ